MRNRLERNLAFGRNDQRDSGKSAALLLEQIIISVERKIFYNDCKANRIFSTPQKCLSRKSTERVSTIHSLIFRGERVPPPFQRSTTSFVYSAVRLSSLAKKGRPGGERGGRGEKKSGALAERRGSRERYPARLSHYGRRDFYFNSHCF